jgi:hypothetical protein
MKKQILFIVFVVAFQAINAQTYLYYERTPNPEIPAAFGNGNFGTFNKTKQENNSILDEGWYKADIKYTCNSTNTSSDYVLKVYVSGDRVTKIDFGNGGSVHTGYNSEGYKYTGGGLNFEKGTSGKFKSVTTIVKVTSATGTSVKYYEISLW